MAATALKRGDIFWVDLFGAKGSEIDGKIRPALVIQNDIGNQYSPVTIVAPLTGQRPSGQLYPTEVAVAPADVLVGAQDSGLAKASTIQLNQIRTVDKTRLRSRIGRVSPSKMLEVDKAIKISLGL